MASLIQFYLALRNPILIILSGQSCIESDPNGFAFYFQLHNLMKNKYTTSCMRLYGLLRIIIYHPVLKKGPAIHNTVHISFILIIIAPE
jgi:hypothetical protein